MGISNYLKSIDQGKEKHLPYIEYKECVSCGELNLTIQIGKETIHPSLVDHAIKTIIVYGVTEKAEIKQLTVFHLEGEFCLPIVRTSIKKGLFQKIIATSYCNLHGLWENEFVF